MKEPGMKVTGLFACLCLLASAIPPAFGQSPDAPNLKPFVGWWIGQGRLGFRGGKSETIKCRATYRQASSPSEMEQTIRCATTSGTVEIRCELKLLAGALTGSWHERKYDLRGELRGKAVPGGFKVNVSGENIKADMTVVMRGDRQLVEVQFHQGSLLGLNVIMQRGAS